MNKYFKEAVLWVLIAIPFVYLALIWSNLPEKVPTHFGSDGTVDGWSGKTSLIFITGLPGIGIYLLMLIIPVLDPKKKIEQMGSNYYKLRFIITLFFSLLMTYCLYLSNVGTMKSPNVLFALVGLLFASLGFYFPTLKSNYFIGLRTPWTLESEQVWIKTHRLAGPIWMTGGLLITFLSFIITDHQVMLYLLFALLLIMAIIPIIFSYTEFQKEKKQKP
jgi:uncharacterized membrane protein